MHILIHLQASAFGIYLKRPEQIACQRSLFHGVAATLALPRLLFDEAGGIGILHNVVAVSLELIHNVYCTHMQSIYSTYV